MPKLICTHKVMKKQAEETKKNAHLLCSVKEWSKDYIVEVKQIVNYLPLQSFFFYQPLHIHLCN